MTKRLLALPTVFTITLLIGICGCNAPESASVDTPKPVKDAHDAHDTGGDLASHDHAAQDTAAIPEHVGTAKTDMEKMTGTLASLPAEDRESAMNQHICPVSGKMLGTMGLPKKVDVNGQPVWICCNGCKDKLLADPDKYLAKIAK